MNILLQYDWPGNIRELENTIENAVVMTDSNFIDIKDLPAFLQSKTEGESESSVVIPKFGGDKVSFKYAY